MMDSTFKNANILIVDDQQANIDILTGLLEIQGYVNLKTTTDPRLVVDLFKNFKPDLILLDLAMPHFTGFQVMEQLKPLIPAYCYMPILVNTADISPDAKRRALGNGAKDFLTKPFDLIEVDLRIKNLLETRYLHQRLENQNLILEEKVKERTIELETTNQELVIAKEKAEASDYLKTAFIQNISHEVRTPLNGILGFSKILSEPDLFPEEKQQYIEYLDTSSDRLLSTITDYMDIAMIASDTLQVNKKQFELQSLLKELNTKFQSRCTAKKLQFRMQLPDGPIRIQLNSDERLLEKAMSHLLNNAVKFTKEGGITLGYTINMDKFEFFVKDTGIGINSDAIPRIFENFGQEEITSARNFEGSGLGLSIVKGLAELLDGNIRVETEKGVGSSFFFSIPYVGREGETILTKEKKKEIPCIKKPVILIAEDDEANIQLIKTILRKSGVTIISAFNGKEAVDLCRDYPEISLVLMDIKMPVMDGIEATRLVRSLRKDLPIIACTAYAMSGDENMILEAGCNDYLSKPIQQEKLISLISEYFPGSINL